MVGTIVPIVYGEGYRQNRVLCFYVLGSVAGAMIAGGIMAYAGHRLFYDTMGSAVVSGFTGLLCGVFAARDLQIVRLRLPQSFWQVPRRWIERSHTKGAFLFGVTLGMGVLTRLPTSGLYAAIVFVAMLGRMDYGVAIFTAFGLGRVVPALVVRGLATDASQIAIWTERFDRAAVAAYLVSGLTLAFGGGWLLMDAL